MMLRLRQFLRGNKASLFGCVLTALLAAGPAYAFPDLNFVDDQTLEIDDIKVINASLSSNNGSDLGTVDIGVTSSNKSVAIAEASDATKDGNVYRYTLTITARAVGSTTLTIDAIDSNNNASNQEQLTVWVKKSTLDGSIVTSPTIVPTMSEDLEREVRVQLSKQPRKDVTVSVTSGDETVASIDKDELTFTTANWSVDQTVTITGLVDADTEDNDTTVFLKASDGGYSGVEKNLSVTVEEQPGAPVNLAVFPGNEEAILSWEMPTVGGTPYSWKYAYKESTALNYPDQQSWHTIACSGACPAGATEHVVRDGGLFGAGSTIDFLLVAVDQRGVAGARAEATSLKFDLKPTRFAATAGDREATLSWDALTDIGGWQYRQKGGGGDYGSWIDIAGSGSTTDSYVVTGLTAGSTYTFQVRAERTDGTFGAESDQLAVTPAAGNAPSFGDQSVADQTYKQGKEIQSLALPAAIGGDGTLSYTLTPGLPAGLSLDTTTRTISGTPSAKHNAKTYTWTAADTDGDQAIVQFEIVVEATLTSPTGFKATPGDGEVVLSWDPHPDLDHSDESKHEYFLHYGKGNSAEDLPLGVSTLERQTSHTVKNLDNGDQYVFGIIAYNSTEASVSAVVLATPQVTPEKPTQVVATPSNNRVRLLWDAIDDVSPWQYRYRSDNNAFSEWTPVPLSDSSTTGYDVTGLTNGTAYDFQVRAVRGGVDGETSDTVSATPGEITPNAPTDLAAVVGEGSVSLSWTPPTNTILEKQQVCWKPAHPSLTDCDDWTNLAVSTTEHLVTALTYNISYKFRVRAVSVDGAGEVASLTASPTAVAPGKPSGLAAVAGDGTVSLSWQAIDTATGWQYQQKKQGDSDFGAWTDIASSGAATTSHELTGLSNSTTYSFRVRAGRYGMWGATSDPVEATPSQAPTGFFATASQSRPDVVDLRWSDAVNSNITKWQYQVAEGTDAFGTNWKDIPGSDAATRAHSVSNLAIGTTWRFRVRAVANGNIPQNPSDEKSVTLQALSGWLNHKTEGCKATLPGNPGDFTLSRDSAPVVIPIAFFADNCRPVGGHTGGNPPSTGWKIVVSWDNGPVNLNFPGYDFRTLNIGSSTTYATINYLYSPMQLRVSPGTKGGTANVFIRITNVDSIGEGETGINLDADFKVTLVGNPVFDENTTIADQHYAKDSAISSPTLPAATGGDGKLKYTVSPALPTGLVFDGDGADDQGLDSGVAPSLTGTPTVPWPWTTHTITVHDDDTDTSDADSDSISFQLRVNVPPTVANEVPPQTVAVGTTKTVDLSQVFSDDNFGDGNIGETLTITAVSNDEVVAASDISVPSKPPFTITLSGNTLTLEGENEGTGLVILAATDLGGEVVTESFTVTSIATPSPVTGLTAAPGDGKVTLSWALPASDSTATGVEIRYKEKEQGVVVNPSTTWTDWADAEGDTSHTITGLSNGIEYSFEVRATNAVGGSDAESVDASPLAKPAKPDLAAVPGDGKVTLSWTDPGNSSITGYQLQQKEGDAEYGAWGDIVGSGASTTSHEVAGLTNEITYRFKIRAVNASGEGVASDEVLVTPQAPRIVTLALDHASISENGGVATVTATLDKASNAETAVEVAVTPVSPAVAGDYTLSGSMLTIAAGATTSTGSVTVTGVDNNVDAPNKTLTVSATAASTQGLTGPDSLTLILNDDDDAGLTLSGTSVTVDKGGSETFTVKLATEPSADVTVTLSSDDTDVTVNPTSLTFKSTDYSTAQTVTVGMAADPADGAATISLSASGGDDYDSLTASVAVSANVLPSFGTATIDAQNYIQGVAIQTLTLPEASGGNGTLNYSLTPPAGLTFNATTRELTGTPSAVLMETEYTYTATDVDGDTAELTFNIEVAADATPSFGTATIDAQNYIQGVAIATLTLPEASGGNGTLGYSFTPPAGLSFDATTRELTGTPSAVLTETKYTYTATDVDGDTAELTFNIEVVANATPSFGTATIAAQSYIQGVVIATLTLPEASGGNGTLIYSFTPPAGLSFNTTTRELTGTPSAVLTETEYTYTATDTDGDTAELTFSIEMVADATPSFGTATIGTQSYIQGVAIATLTLPEASGGNGTLSYSFAPPAGLSFDATTRELTGTPSAVLTETEYTYTATDVDGDTAELTFNIEVVANATPSFGTATIATQSYIQGVAIQTLTLPEASGGNGTLSYSLTPPAGLTFNAATRELTGTPSASQAETEYTYTATDTDGDTAELTFNIEVVADATPSFGTATIAAQSYIQGVAIATLTLPEASGGNGTLSYSLTPPIGLSFNTATRELTGTSSALLTETEYTYTATDVDGDTAELTFTIEVVADATPSFGTATIDAQSYTQGTAITTLTLPAATGGNGVLTYALGARPALPAGLSFNATTRELTGTPSVVLTETEYIYTATDANGDTAELTFTIAVANATPSFGRATIAAQSYNQGAAIATLTLPEANGGNAPLSYSLTPPAGLSFNATTRELTGKPTNLQTATQYTYTVTDADDDTAELTFTIEVVLPPQPNKPTGLTTTAGDAEVTLAWTDPGNTSITKYQLRYGTHWSGSVPPNATWVDIPNSADGEENALDYTVTGLTNGAHYAFQIRAVNAGGESDASDEVTEFPSINEQPPAPTITSVGPGSGDGDLKVVWSWSRGNSMCDVDRYFIEYKKSDNTIGWKSDVEENDPNTSTHGTYEILDQNLGNAVNGKVFIINSETTGSTSNMGQMGVDLDDTSYDVRMDVYSLNCDSYSTRTISIGSGQRPLYLLEQPTSFTATQGNGKVTLAATVVQRGPAIQKWQYLYKKGSLDYGNWADIPDSASTSISGKEVTGLASGTYTFKVRGVHEQGAGAASDEVMVTLVVSEPVAPTGLSANMGDTAVTLGWDDPQDATITGYQLRQAQGATVPDSTAWTDITGSSASTTSHTVSGLTNDTQYAFQIRAVNTTGDGATSATVTATPTGTVSGSAVTLQATAPTDTTAPTVTITTSDADLTAGETAVVTVTFSEPVTGFAADELTASTGNLSGFTGSGDSYTATLTPPENAKGTITLSVAAGAAEDSAGNSNSAAPHTTLSYNTITIATASAQALGEVNTVNLPDVIHNTVGHHVEVLTARLDSIDPLTLGQGGSPISMGLEEMGNAIASTVFDYGDELANGTVDWQQALGGRSFSFPAASISSARVIKGPDGMDGQNLGLFSTLSFWGRADYSSFSREVDHNNLQADTDGDTFTVYIGADVQPIPDLVTGLSLAFSRSHVDWDGKDGVNGTHTVNFTTVHPYVSWFAGDWQLWTSGLFGSGDTEWKPEGGGVVEENGSVSGIAGGVRFRFWSSAAEAYPLSLSLKLDGATASFLGVDAQQARLAIEADRQFPIHTGELTGSLSLGLRIKDDNTYGTGTAVEVGAGTTWQGERLALNGQGRLLFGLGEQEWREWGISGTVLYSPGSDGEGVMVSLEPSIGVTNSKQAELWSLTGSDLALGSGQEELEPRLRAELAYGLRRGALLLTPYTELSITPSSNIYGIGVRYDLGSDVTLDLHGSHTAPLRGERDNSVKVDLNTQF